MKKYYLETFLIVALIILVGALTYSFKYQQDKRANYALTSQAPVVSVDEKGQVFVRTDCTTEEYRNTIGQLTTEILQLRAQQMQKPPAKVEAPK